MEGPTPVSALIHAATMVAAGIFLLARISFLLTPDARLFITIIGTITMLIGALKALNEWDIKKVLAYSTMSQLGLMVVAVGFGSWQTALFHLLTHAFFKAGLFLSAGSVIHAMHPHGEHADFDPQDMRTMGGLRKALPITFICFTICAASLAGLPLFSGFLSKDAIITQGFANAGEWGAIGYIFPALALFSAGLTAYYMTRQLWLVFFGSPRYAHSIVHPHESPAIMWVPMALLALLSFFWWFSFNPFEATGWFYDWVKEHPAAHIGWVPPVAVLTSLVSIYLAYRKAQQPDPFGATAAQQSDIGSKRQISWLRDYSQDQYFIIPFSAITAFLKIFEARVIDAFIDALSKVSVIAAHVISWVDRHVVDGLVALTVWVIRSVGRNVKNLQTGQIQSYYVVTAVGVFFLILWLVIA
jgi:NADH-quinone oxidoreductase subunit L